MFTKKPSYVPMKLSNVNYETVHTMFTKKLLYVPITPSNVFNEIFLCLQRNLTMFKTKSKKFHIVKWSAVCVFKPEN